MNCAYPAFIEICGHAGFDFAVIDMEHGPLHPLAAEDLCRAADCTGIAPIIRVRKNDGPQIQRALDIGSAGVQVPQIESKIDAETAVKSAKYSPLGDARPFLRYAGGTLHRRRYKYHRSTQRRILSCDSCRRQRRHRQPGGNCYCARGGRDFSRALTICHSRSAFPAKSAIPESST